jgi:hypothetical protein
MYNKENFRKISNIIGEDEEWYEEWYNMLIRISKDAPDVSDLDKEETEKVLLESGTNPLEGDAINSIFFIDAIQQLPDSENRIRELAENYVAILNDYSENFPSMDEKIDEVDYMTDILTGRAVTNRGMRVSHILLNVYRMNYNTYLALNFGTFVNDYNNMSESSYTLNFLDMEVSKIGYGEKDWYINNDKIKYFVPEDINTDWIDNSKDTGMLNPSCDRPVIVEVEDYKGDSNIEEGQRLILPAGVLSKTNSKSFLSVISV